MAEKRTIHQVKAVGKELDEIIKKLKTATKAQDEFSAGDEITKLMKLVHQLGLSYEEMRKKIESVMLQIDNLGKIQTDLNKTQQERNQLTDQEVSSINTQIDAIKARLELELKGKTSASERVQTSNQLNEAEQRNLETKKQEVAVDEKANSIAEQRQEQQRQILQRDREQAQIIEQQNTAYAKIVELKRQAKDLGVEEESAQMIREYQRISEDLIATEKTSTDEYRRKLELQKNLLADIKEHFNHTKNIQKENEKAVQQQQNMLVTEKQRLKVLGEFEQKTSDLSTVLSKVTQLPIDMESLSQYEGVTEALKEQEVLQEKLARLDEYRKGIKDGSIKTEQEINLVQEELRDTATDINKQTQSHLNLIYDIHKLDKERIATVEAIRDAGLGENAAQKANEEYKKMINNVSQVDQKQRQVAVSAEKNSTAWREVKANVKQANHYLDMTASHTARAQRAGRGFSETLRDAFREAFTLEKVANRIAFVITAKLSYDAFKYMHRGLREGIRLAMEFEDTLARVYSLLGEDDSPALRSEFAEASRSSMVRYAQTIETTNRALYDIISAQIDTNHATEVLNSTMRLAVAEFTDVKIATDAVTTTLNAYNMEASRSADVTDLLSTIVTQGKTTLQDLAPVWGRVAAVGGMFNVQIEDLAASVAIMTQQGLSAGEATTALRQLLLTIMNPTDKAKRAIEQYGLEMDAATLRTKGFGYIIEQVAKIQDEEVITTLASSRRGVMAFAAGLSDTERYARTYNAMLDRTGETQRKFGELVETDSFRMEQMKAQFADAALVLGQEVMPSLTLGIGAMRDFAKGMSTLIGLLGQGTVAMLAFSAIAVKLTPMLLANPFIGTAAILATLIGLVGAYRNRTKELVEITKQLRDEYIETMRIEQSQLRSRREMLVRMVELEGQSNRNAEADAELAQIQEALGEELHGTADAMERVNEEMSRVDTEEAILSFKLYREEIAKTREDVVDFIRDIPKSFRAIERETRSIRPSAILMEELSEAFDKRAGIFTATPFVGDIGELTTDEQIKRLEEFSGVVSQAIKNVEEAIRSERRASRAQGRALEDSKSLNAAISQTIGLLKDEQEASAGYQEQLEREEVARKSILALAGRGTDNIYDTAEQYKEVTELVTLLEERLEGNQEAQDKLNNITAFGLREGTEAYKLLLGLALQYSEAIGETPEPPVPPEYAPAEIAKRREALEEQLAIETDMAAGRAKEEIELEKIRREHEKILKQVRAINESKLPIGYLKEFEGISHELFRLQKNRLETQKELNEANVELGKILNQQKVVAEAIELGFEIDAKMPTEEDAKAIYDRLIKAQKAAGEDTIATELELFKALEEIRRQGLSDFERFEEDQDEAWKQRNDAEQLRLQLGIKQLKDYYGEQFDVTGQSYVDLKKLLEDQDTTEFQRLVIHVELDRRGYEQELRDIQDMFTQFEKDMLDRVISSPLPSQIVQMMSGFSERAELNKKLSELTEGTEAYLQVEKALQQDAYQRRVQAEQYIASQLQDIWNSYLQIRKQQIQEEYDEAASRIQRRYELEFRSKTWLDAEMAKLDEEKAKREKKLRQQEQVAALASATMNIALAITKVLHNPILTAIVASLGAIQLGIIASQSFAQGGYTGKSNMKRDKSGERPVGTVHEEEFVFDKKATKGNVGLLYTIRDILAGKGSGVKRPQISGSYATGGYTGKAAASNVTVGDGWSKSEIRELLNAIKEDRIYIETKTIDPVKVSKLADRGRATRERVGI